jgi:hypothetical protein
MIPDSVSILEAVWILFGTGVGLVIAFNLTDALSDVFLCIRRRITGAVLQSAKINVRNEVFYLLMELCSITVGVVAAMTPMRPDPQYRYASIVSSIALITNHALLGMLSIWNRASRRAELKALSRPGETTGETLSRIAQHKRRVDDPPAESHNEDRRLTNSRTE